jgi:hypothetical protein
VVESTTRYVKNAPLAVVSGEVAFDDVSQGALPGADRLDAQRDSLSDLLSRHFSLP